LVSGKDASVLRGNHQPQVHFFSGVSKTFSLVQTRLSIMQKLTQSNGSKINLHLAAEGKRIKVFMAKYDK